MNNFQNLKQLNCMSESGYELAHCCQLLSRSGIQQESWFPRHKDVRSLHTEPRGFQGLRCSVLQAYRCLWLSVSVMLTTFSKKKTTNKTFSYSLRFPPGLVSLSLPLPVFESTSHYVAQAGINLLSSPRWWGYGCAPSNPALPFFSMNRK